MLYVAVRGEVELVLLGEEVQQRIAPDDVTEDLPKVALGRRSVAIEAHAHTDPLIGEANQPDPGAVSPQVDRVEVAAGQFPVGERVVPALVEYVVGAAGELAPHCGGGETIIERDVVTELLDQQPCPS